MLLAGALIQHPYLITIDCSMHIEIASISWQGWKICAMARCRKKCAGGGGAYEGVTSGVGGVRVPEGSSICSSKGLGT